MRLGVFCAALVSVCTPTTQQHHPNNKPQQQQTTKKTQAVPAPLFKRHLACLAAAAAGYAVFASVRGAGHMVPETRPEAALELFRRGVLGKGF